MGVKTITTIITITTININRAKVIITSKQEKYFSLKISKISQI